MNNSLERKIQIKRDNLDNNDYLRSLAEEAFRVGYIGESEYKTLVEGLFKLLSDEVLKYTKGESSSVRTEAAKTILDSLCFEISIFLKGIPDCDKAARILVEQPIEIQLAKGRKLFEASLRTALSMYKKIKNNRIKVDESSYNNVIDKDIINILKRYINTKKKLIIHETSSISTLSYPLALPIVNDGNGVIDYLIRYQKVLWWENEFCSIFDIDKINSLIRTAVKNKFSQFNIFEKVLYNGCVNLILGDAGELEVNIGDIEYLIQHFGEKFIYALAKAAEIYLEKLSSGDEFLSGYIKRIFKTNHSSFDIAMKAKNFSAIFILDGVQHNENGNEQNNQIQSYLSRDEFLELSDEIRFCDTIEKKIALFSTVTNIHDFIELLEADCLYADEYKAFFNGIDENSFKLLSDIAIEKNDEGSGFEWVSSLIELLEKGKNNCDS